jgi:hypothetical protein
MRSKQKHRREASNRYLHFLPHLLASEMHETGISMMGNEGKGVAMVLPIDLSDKEAG